ncbi:MAG: diaminopimelate epimerase, partial [Phycisphaerae bacterium]|nr:diaminopimelate epimerase [Phycisphaerae bacterium]
MTGEIEFAKLSGSGNDFVCIDNRKGKWDEVLSDGERIGCFARALCCRGMGVGADGIIFACEPEIEGVADIAARFFEADGSEAELCGNGTGCFIHWVTASGWVDDGESKILTPAGVVRGQNSDGEYVRVCIPTPEDMRRDRELSVDGSQIRYDFVITGVPHVIVYVDDVEMVDVAHLGAALRHHERFKPRGANVNFVQVLSEGNLAVRTFEFGVEGETLA